MKEDKTNNNQGFGILAKIYQQKGWSLTERASVIDKIEHLPDEARLALEALVSEHPNLVTKVFSSIDEIDQALLKGDLDALRRLAGLYNLSPKRQRKNL